MFEIALRRIVCTEGKDIALPYRFCPECGGPVELRVVKEGEPERDRCTSCGKIHYEDPKVAACTIFELAGGIVLARRAIKPGYGKWVFPGGYVDRGEPVAEAAVRETREETGITVRLGELVGVYSYQGVPVVVIVYAAEAQGGTLEALDECLDVKAFPPDELPWDELAFTSTREALEAYLKMGRP